MTAPTATDVENWSQVAFDELNADVALLVTRAVAYVEWATGRTFADMPVGLEPLAQQAVQFLVEDAAYQSTPDSIEVAEDWMTVQSFSAGSYSETRRSLSDLAKSGMINADPRIHGTLWALLTDDRRDDWDSWMKGTYGPGFTVTEPDWGVASAFDPEPRGISWPPPLLDR